MKRLKNGRVIRASLAAIFSVVLPFVTGSNTLAQSNGPSAVTAVPVTIPVAIRVKGRVPPESELRPVDFTISEDGQPQTILSIRAMGTNSPINLLVLIQDDVVSSVALEIKPLAEFIRRLPRGSRVSVAYMRTGSLQVRQKFTSDLEKAARSLRSPLGLSSAAPYNPYVELIDATKRFDSQPAGRRAVLMVSDGVDVSRGFESTFQSIDLERAITEAQRRAVAVYAFFAPTVGASGNGNLIPNGQSSLQKLSDQTGGHAYFQGLSAPTSFDPFIRELSAALDRQIALTYLSTHPKKGFHRIKIVSLTPDVELNYPSGYRR
jgi:VWFA-related protein